MQKIYVILSHSGTKVSKMFYFLTRAKYTHTSICLDDSFTTFYSFARRNINYPIFAGITDEHPNEGIFGIYKSDCAVYEVTISDEKYENIKNQINHMLNHKKIYTYNFIGIPLIRMRIPIKRKHHFTCTQFVAYILENNDVKIIETPWELAMPQSFKDLKGDLIFEGKVNDLPNHSMAA